MLAEGSASNAEYILDWNKWVPSKCNIFVWRAVLNRIPTSNALIRRGIMVGDGFCPLCKSDYESVDHLFTACLFATVLWQKVSRWCRIPPIFAFSFKDLLEVYNSAHVNTTVRPIVHGILFSSAWCLWKARNKALFSGVEVNVDCIFSEVKSLGFLWCKYRSRNSHISCSDWCNFSFM
ncbi:putative reverse transcriptase zinc-binding domain-containing protein [Helianthus annuus]|nr:putative reverse transcriptase zinc-binding domain-containing protein [Helianthus annuus]KAJ0899220.1 putative reverse transcriptase zinc-binding domain-containing protein [Helianthus annuus]